MTKPHLTLLKREEQDFEIAYLLKGLLPRKGLVVFLGKSGAGKTQLAMHAASSIALKGVFGIFESPNKKIMDTLCAPPNMGFTVYLAGEGKANIRARIKSAELALNLLDQDTLEESYAGILPIIPITVDIPLSGVEQIPELDEKIAGFIGEYPYVGDNPSLIVFDTLASIFPIKDENSNSEMQRVVSYLSAYADHYDCCVVVITHPPKSNDGPKGYSRGASALINSADVVIELERINGSRRRFLTITKMRDGPYENSKIHFQVETFGDAAAIVPLLEIPKCKNEKSKASKKMLTERQQQVLRVLNQNSEGVFQKAIAKEIFEDAQRNTHALTEINKTSHERMTRRAIEQLGRFGQLRIDKMGKESFITLLTVANSAPEIGDGISYDEDDAYQEQRDAEDYY